MPWPQLQTFRLEKGLEGLFFMKATNEMTRMKNEMKKGYVLTTSGKKIQY